MRVCVFSAWVILHLEVHRAASLEEMCTIGFSGVVERVLPNATPIFQHSSWRKIVNNIAHSMYC